MKRLILLFAMTTIVVSCTKKSYVVTGTAKGIENGKTIILETQDEAGAGLKAVDTVKVENGKFEIKGTAAEPSFHMLQVEGVNGKFPFILENGDIAIEIDKDSINKSKVTGTYSNEEFVKFNEEITKIQKSLMDFQTKNTPAMTKAQQTKDTVTINKLMAEYNVLQEKANAQSKSKYNDYAETHPKSFISALIIQGMIGDPAVDMKKVQKLYDALDESLKKTKAGKAIAEKLKELKSPAKIAAPTTDKK